MVNVKVDYTTDLGHNGKGLQELTSEFLKDGLSKEDAEYYAKMDILFAQIKRHNIDLDLDNVQALDNEYVRANRTLVRQKALNLDKAALKSLLNQSATTIDKKTEQEALKQLKDGVNEVTITYEDGSTRTIKTTKQDITITSVPISNTSMPKLMGGVSDIPGPWGNSYSFLSQDPYITTSGRKSLQTEVTFKSGTYFGKVNDTYFFTVYNHGYTDTSKWTAEYYADQGSVSGGGSVVPTDEVDSNHTYETCDANTAMNGFTDGIFTLQASTSTTINLQFLDFTFSVSGGAKWHEYAIDQVALVIVPEHFFGWTDPD